MPRRAYIADLQQLAAKSGVGNISNVRAGDDDGEFRFAITTGDDNATYQISALIPDVSEYPSGHEYHIFGDDSAPAHVGRILNNLPSTFALPLSELLDLVANAFTEDQDGDAVMQDSQFDGGLSDDDDEFGTYSEDDMFGDNRKSSTNITSTAQFTTVSATSAALRDRIRSDLKTAKAAGFRVGHQGPLLEGQNSYVSISIRISKLGISEEAMQAWELEPSEYLVLIIQYPVGYQNLDDVQACDPTSARKAISFRIGVSNQYKPTLQEAIAAFTKLSGEDEAKQQREQLEQAKSDSRPSGLRDAFISRPMNELLNDRLPTILKYRLIGMSWAGAEEFFNDYQGKAFTMTGMDYMDNKYMQPEPPHPSFPSIVTADHLLDAKPGQRLSLPLLGMQFILRHFVRCTEFCLVCHCKLEDNLEALKPYVCDKPLCLYQYMSLGFGPSIEHEIISQPYVVDLLTSFCYHSAMGGKLGVFPDGLSLNVPPPHFFTSYATSSHGYYARGLNQQPTPAVTPSPEAPPGYKARLNSQTHEILFERGHTLPVRVGDWICFSSQGEPSLWQHCRITETHMFPVIRVTERISRPVTDLTDGKATTTKSTAAEKSTFDDITFYKYDTNFDNLDVSQKRGAIITQLDLLPPVQELKNYLLRSRITSLASWTDRISPTACGILRWIIASNRACIVAVDVPDQPLRNQDERIQGMDGWMQFKFAMGAPDKERRFISAMQSTQTRLKLAHPTLFAWHGSPMHNWHSIIREGLHFRETINGRAFGNGCYHSLDFNTSYGYSGYHNYRQPGQGGFGSWPASELNIGCAMALNEIVNAPLEFVSKAPHLVVAQLDWIQTRYLFVQCGNPDLKFNDVGTKSGAYFTQDPHMTPNGQKAKISIPLSLMPRSRRGDNGKERAKKKLRQTGTSVDPIAIDVDISDAASDVTDIEDINILIENDEDYVAAAVQDKAETQSVVAKSKGKFSGLFSGLKSKASSKSTTAGSSKPLTDFEPGQLDYSTLPVLAEPSFATTAASRRLQKDFQALLKAQETTPLHELGWYTNPEQFNNMYQWIVELHSFEETLPLAKQMKQKGIKSVVMEMRFGPDYPMSPPFIRVIKPRFLNFMAGGGGHVTAGGSICMELLTNNGWSAVSSIESVLLQVRLAISSTDPRPAQLEQHARAGGGEYGIGEAVDAYVRACTVHGWKPPDNFRQTAFGGQEENRYGH
jgi:ubiquitin-conjugating enzyme E2 Q